LSHKGQALQNLDKYNEIKNSNLVYASQSRDDKLFNQIAEKLGSDKINAKKNDVQAFIIT